MADKKVVQVVKKALEGSKERKFLESVELAINLKDVDLSKPKNRLNEEIVLPKGRGKPVKVAVFASGELAVKAKKSADLVIAPEEIEDIAGDKKKAKKIANEYGFFVAEAPLMPTVGKTLGIYLGPRGKMPKPVPPNIDPAAIIDNLRKSILVRSKSNRTFHAPVGTKDMSPGDIAENIDAVIKRIISKLERGKMNIASAYVKTTMGPPVKLM